MSIQIADLVQHAADELLLYGKTEKEIEDYLAVIQVFTATPSAQKDPEGTAQIITDLLFMRNLTPITDDQEEWILLPGSETADSPGVWQNKRNPAIFSMDKGKTYYSLRDVKAALGAASSQLSRTSASKVL